MVNAVVIELQKENESVKSVLLDDPKVLSNPTLLNEVYDKVFAGLIGDAVVIELRNDDKTVISISLEPNKFPISEIIEYLNETVLTKSNKRNKK
jgi:hypothetical protein